MDKRYLVNLPSIRKYASRKEWENACWGKILKSEELLELLLTSHERHSLVMRAATLKELILGKGPRQISRELFVSSQTINVIKKAIAEGGYRSYLERSKKERKKKVYSSGPKRKPKWEHVGEIGFYRRTKYGKIWIRG